MSKFPIVADKFWRNTHLPVYLGHQRTEIRLPSELVVVYNTHPMIPFNQAGKAFNAGLRWAEIDSVLQRAAADPRRVILAGDFNMNDLAADYRRITARYVDAYRTAGWGMGFTFPDFRAANASLFGVGLPLPPLVRIDHVFHTRDIRALEARVWRTSGGSDHRPVFVRLALLPA
jgi:endonuclease/exonuclease/phosphatase (EEP) superfamily protein YafD